MIQVSKISKIINYCQSSSVEAGSFQRIYGFFCEFLHNEYIVRRYIWWWTFDRVHGCDLQIEYANPNTETETHWEIASVVMIASLSDRLSRIVKYNKTKKDGLLMGKLYIEFRPLDPGGATSSSSSVRCSWKFCSSRLLVGLLGAGTTQTYCSFELKWADLLSFRFLRKNFRLDSRQRSSANQLRIEYSESESVNPNSMVHLIFI